MVAGLYVWGLVCAGTPAVAQAEKEARPARPLRLFIGLSRFWEPSFGGGGGAYAGIAQPLPGVYYSLYDDTHPWIVGGGSYDLRRYKSRRLPQGVVLSAYLDTAAATEGQGVQDTYPRYTGIGASLRGETRLLYLGVGAGMYSNGHPGGRIFAGLPTRSSLFLEVNYTAFLTTKGHHVPRTDPALVLGLRL